MRDLIAATATAERPLPWGPLLGALTFALLVYVASCAWRPFGYCWCCKGSGRHHRKDRKVFRNCRWCRGSGRRLRVGRKVWNRFAKVRNAAR